MGDSYPISEIFGPTIQGEGPEIGRQVMFVRFAGCDFDCSWCDTKYAVRPSYPGWKVTQASFDDILERLYNLSKTCTHVILSGGNPALFVDNELFNGFKNAGYTCAMETQGSKFGGVWVWHGTLKTLVVSPKPPSSGMAEKFDAARVRRAFETRTRLDQFNVLKYVAFDDIDLKWILETEETFKDCVYVNDRFISIGTDIAHPTRDDILDRTKYLIELVLADSRFSEFRVTPQLHALVWGQTRGR